MSEKSKISKNRENQARAHPTSRTPQELPVPENALIKLQRRVGNRAVQRLVDGNRNRVRRQASSPNPVPEEEEPFATAGLGVQGRTPGHGDLGNQNLGAPPAIQRENGSGSSVNANMTFTQNDPAVTRRPAADIASGHGQANAAGWTTPRYNVTVPFANPSRVDINVTLDFDMELASEYTGATLSVLQDHENGHVNIGREKGQAHLVDDLEGNLESNTALTPPVIQTAIQSAASTFVTQEQTASQSYDATDYPRMHQAYLGARTPLADLEASSGAISLAATRLRSFIGGVMAGLQGQAAMFADDAATACQALSANELSILQYNPEFKTLVATARSKIDEYIESFHYDFWIIDFSMLSDRTRTALENLAMVLSGFTWAPPV